MTIAGFSKVGIVGAGQMGSGIAQVCATCGLEITLVDLAAQQLEKGRATIEKSLGRLVSKEKMSQDEADKALQRITLATDSSQLSDADLVIESAVENEEIKRKIFGNLDEIL